MLSKTVLRELPPTDNLFQSGFWGQFKQNCGHSCQSFIAENGSVAFPLLVISRRSSNGIPYAYIPHGPDIAVDEDQRGLFLEELSSSLQQQLSSDHVCIRWDTAWPSPFTSSDYYTRSGQWKGAPRNVVRELRMNMGTRERKLHKAPLDHLSPDTVIISLKESEDEILMRMRQTTRNSVRKALKSGLEINIQDRGYLPRWYSLYKATAERKGLYFEKESYFEKLLQTAAEQKGGMAPSVFIISAEKDSIPLAGFIVAISGTRAWFLFAGSSLAGREYMPNYGLQWETIRYLRKKGCTSYDLMGVPPNNDPYHSMYGLYTFKTGLGGRLVHYSGCWDYPLDNEGYTSLRNTEILTS